MRSLYDYKPPEGKGVNIGVSERERTHALKGADVLYTVWNDGLDSHQLSVCQPLAGAGYPPCDGGSISRCGRIAEGDPIALRQKATPSGNSLKPI